MLNLEQIFKLKELGFQKIEMDIGTVYRKVYDGRYLDRLVKYDIWDDGCQSFNYCKNIPEHRADIAELEKVGIR